MVGYKTKRIGLIKAKTPDVETSVEKLQLLGNNTGNMLFWNSIQKLINADTVLYSSLEDLSEITKKYDALITTDYIWICEGTKNTLGDTFKRILKYCDIPVVPMSIGLQAKNFDVNFKIDPEIVRQLDELQERCVLGVRGYYTAYILNKYGIKNIQVIGCPSLYYPDDPAFQVNNDSFERMPRTICNFKVSPEKNGAFGTWLPAHDKAFLYWCAKNKLDFIEQTRLLPGTKHENSSSELEKNLLSQWYADHAMFFFDINVWKEHYKQNVDFSIGSRFHGNIMALWQGRKALFITVDSRTLEMTDFFNLPALPSTQFDESKSIEYYYELADYSLFNQTYKVNFRRYVDFLRINGLV